MLSKLFKKKASEAEESKAEKVEESKAEKVEESKAKEVEESKPENILPVSDPNNKQEPVLQQSHKKQALKVVNNYVVLS